MIAIGTRPETPGEQQLTNLLATAVTPLEMELVVAIVGLRTRLAAAEDALVMTSWSPIDNSLRGKASHELWLRWCLVSGFSSSPTEFPHLTDELIEQLAAKRDAVHKATLARLFGENS